MIQEQFLSYILNKKDSSLITINNLDSSYFSDCYREFSFIMNHYKTYGNIPDVETFLHQFPDFAYSNVSETPSYLISELCKDRQDRVIVDSYNKMQKLYQEGRRDEAIKLLLNTAENTSKGISLQTVDILKDTSRYEAYLEKTQDFKKFYISTGLVELDKIIGGWERQEELATIVARTNVGKSWILIKCAVAAAKQGLKVGIYSGEMSENKVGYRVDTFLGHIPNGSLVHGNIEVQQEYKKYIDSLKDMQGSIKVLTPQMINGSAGVRALRAFIEKDNLDILFIDQHSLLEDDRHGKTPVEKASNISKDLKNLQVMKRLPIISVCQQNRTVTEDKKQDTTQIAMSDRIGQDSTIIIFLERKDDILTISLIKSRDSVNNQVLHYLVNFNTGQLNFIPAENDGVKGETEIDYEHRYDKEVPQGDNVF